MSGVKRFSAPFSQVNESDDGLYVHAEDYDAAQSELAVLRKDVSNWKTKACEAAEREAALREEFERMKNESFEDLYNSAIDERDALREELAKLRERHDTLKCQRNDAQQRLTAAEQRNAELVELLKMSSELFWAIEDDLGAISASAVGVMRVKIDEAINPAES